MSANTIDSSIAAQAESWELRRPETSWVDLALAFAVAIFAAVCIRSFFAFNKLDSDEGIAFQGALRILRGEIPYRDFFSFYTPGSYYLYAGLFSIFGATMGAARSLLVFYTAMFSFVTYLLARRISSRAASLLVACLLALICLPSRFENLHSWDSTAVALIALYSAVWFLQTSAKWWAFSAGFFTGCSAMIEQTRGTGMLVGLALAGAVFYAIDRKKWPLRCFLPAALGSTIPVLFVIVYFASRRAITPMFAGWFWPLHHYMGANKLAYGYIFYSQAHIFGSTGMAPQVVFALILSAMMIVSLLPILIISLGVSCFVKIQVQKAHASPLLQLALFSGCIALGNFIAAIATSRPDYIRMVYSAPLLFFAIPLLLDTRLVRLPTLTKVRPLITVYLIVSFSFCFSLFHMMATEKAQPVVTRRGIVRMEYGEVVTYLQAHVAAGDKVLIYPFSAMYLFLSSTFSPTRFDYLQVGLHTPAQFEEARQELEHDRTPVVLFDITFPALVPQVWPSTPAEVLAHDPMGDFIFERYRVCKILRPGRRPFAYMVRKDLPCPSD